MTRLHLDYETFAAIDLRKVGAFRYANDTSCVILCAAMALDDEEPEVFCEDVDCGWMINQKYKAALLDPAVLLVCHNAQFEMAVSLALMEKTWGIPCPALSRFRCTMSLARRAALPSKLEKLAEVLGLSQQKDKRGASLIRKFSMMQKGRRVSKKWPQGSGPYRIRPEDDPAAFAEFMAYCAQDVRAEQEVARKLAYFDDPINNANYSLDAVINARGVPVNLAALRHAQRLVDEETEIVSGRFRELCGFEITQNARLLSWLKTQGVDLPDLQAETIENFLEEQTV
jgi:DNA polymerase